MFRRKELKPYNAEDYTGTQNLFWRYCKTAFPETDVSPENIPKLTHFLHQVCDPTSPVAAERTILFYGLGCRPHSLKELAEKYDVGIDRICGSLFTAFRNVMCDHKADFLAFYGITPETVSFLGEGKR